MAEVTRSLLSLTAVSGNPTTAILWCSPNPAWTSISTSNPLLPSVSAQLADETSRRLNEALYIGILLLGKRSSQIFQMRLIKI